MHYIINVLPQDIPYLVEVSSELGYDPDDGQPHAGEQGHFPWLVHHKEQEEAKTRRVPHQQA